jgi:hypothetical protein
MSVTVILHDRNGFPPPLARCQPAPAPRPWRQASRPGQEGRPGRRHAPSGTARLGRHGPGSEPPHLTVAASGPAAGARSPPGCGPTTHPHSAEAPWRCGGYGQERAASCWLPQRCSPGRGSLPRPRPQRAAALPSGGACATAAPAKWAGRPPIQHRRPLSATGTETASDACRAPAAEAAWCGTGRGLRTTGTTAPRCCPLDRPEGAEQEFERPCTAHGRPAPSRVASWPLLLRSPSLISDQEFPVRCGRENCAETSEMLATRNAPETAGEPKPRVFPVFSLSSGKTAPQRAETGSPRTASTTSYKSLISLFFPILAWRQERPGNPRLWRRHRRRS